MKKTLIIFFIYIFQFNCAIANTTIAYIDMNKIISTSKPGSYILSQINDISLKNSKVFETSAEKLKEQETKLVSQKNILSELDYQTNINKLKLEIQNYNVNREKINNDLKKLRIDNLNELLKLINQILSNYSNDNSISLIFNKKDLIIGKKELDITDKILKIVNNEIKKFKIQ
tara:strand:- start:165 stop:683 length:519 start_codon:yes stop_codon:yes gene_type:complete